MKTQDDVSHWCDLGVGSAPVPPTGWLPTGSAQLLAAPRRTGLIDARQGREQEREGPSERPVLEKNLASTAPAADGSAQPPAATPDAAGGARALAEAAAQAAVQLAAWVQDSGR